MFRLKFLVATAASLALSAALVGCSSEEAADKVNDLKVKAVEVKEKVGDKAAAVVEGAGKAVEKTGEVIGKAGEKLESTVKKP